MLRAAFRWLLVLALGAGLLGAVLWAASTVDARPPAVVQWSLTQHLADDRVALATTGVQVTFDESVAHASAESAFAIAPPVAGTFSWSGPTLLFTPNEPLPLDTDFAVRIGEGVKDLAGNAMEDASAPFQFVTAGPPELAVSTPIDGAEEVPLDASLVLTFTTLMDTGSVERALRITPAIAYAVRWDGERVTLDPIDPLEPDRRYVVSFGPGATDVGGIRLETSTSISFSTEAGLQPALVVPADQTAGAALGGPIAVVFDEPLDPDSVDPGLLAITPAVLGTLTLAPLDATVDDAPRVLRFDPAEPLPANTTFAVEVGLALRSADDAQLADPIRWSFTTGAPTPTLGNQVLFISARAGVANLWAMNPDGSNERQLSAELSPIVSYAPNPDGRGFVVGDGARLIAYQADGSDRQILTEGDAWEFDPAYRPDGRTLVYGRVDADTGKSLGLWMRDPRGGGAKRVELPPFAALLRSPRFSADGDALAFVVDATSVGILDLGTRNLVAVPFRAVSPPAWLPDGSAVIVAGILQAAASDGPWRAPILPLDPATEKLDPETVETLVLVEIGRDGAAPAVLASDRVARPALSSLGGLAFVRLRTGDAVAGSLVVTVPGRDGELEPLPDGTMDVTEAAFAPEPAELVVARAGVGADGSPQLAGIWRVGLDGTGLRQLSSDGRLPRWMP